MVEFLEDTSSTLQVNKRKSQVSMQSIKEALVEQSKTGDKITDLGQTLQIERVEKS